MLLLSSTFVIGLNSCADHEDHAQQPLDISYRAAYVVNGQDNSISVIRLADNTVTETIELRDAVAPHHISISPDQRQLAVAITSTDLSGGHGGHGDPNANYKVVVLDALTGLPLQELVTPSMPHNAVYSSDGSELWVGQAGSESGKILVYNTSNWSVKNTVLVGRSPSEVTFSQDGTLAFVSNTQEASVTVVDKATKAIVKTIPVGAEPVGAWPAANGKMYVDNEAGQSISVIDVSSLTVEETINLGFKLGYVAYHSGTNELWVSNATDGKAVIFQRTANTWQQKAEAATGADAHAILFNEDMTTAYVTNQGAHTVSVISTQDYTKAKDIAVGKMPNGIVIR